MSRRKHLFYWIVRNIAIITHSMLSSSVNFSWRVVFLVPLETFQAVTFGTQVGLSRLGAVAFVCKLVAMHVRFDSPKRGTQQFSQNAYAHNCKFLCNRTIRSFVSCYDLQAPTRANVGLESCWREEHLSGGFRRPLPARVVQAVV